MAGPKRKRLGEILVEEGILSEFQVNTALTDQKKWGGKLGEHLIRLGYLTEEDMVNALRNQLKIPSVNLRKVKIPTEVLTAIPEDILKKHGVLPVGIKDINGKEFLVIAMSDPSNLNSVDELQFATKYKIMPALAGPVTLERAIRYYLDHEGDLFADDVKELNIREKVDSSVGTRTFAGDHIERQTRELIKEDAGDPPAPTPSKTPGDSPFSQPVEPSSPKKQLEQVRAELSALRNLLIDSGVLDRRAFVEEVMKQLKNPNWQLPEMG